MALFVSIVLDWTCLAGLRTADLGFRSSSDPFKVENILLGLLLIM